MEKFLASYRIRISLLCFLLAAGTGSWMYWLARERAFWGHLPLALFLLVWAGIVFWRFPRWYGSWKLLGLATLSGLLFAAGFPPSPLPFLLFFAFIPLLLAGKELHGQEKSGKRWFALSYHAFMVWNIFSTFWVANSALIAGIFAITANSLLMSLPLVFYFQTQKRSPRIALPALAAYWLTFEYLHYRWELAWPWLSLGNGFATYPSWVQWYEYTGVLGGTLWVLALNFAGLPLVQKWIAGKRSFSFSWGLLLLLPLCFSLYRYFTFPMAADPEAELEVVLIQPNFDPHYEQDEVPGEQQLERILDLAEAQLSAETDLLVLPEATLGPIDQAKLGREPLTQPLTELWRKYPNLSIVAGLTVFRWLAPNEPASPATREAVGQGGRIRRYEFYNAAVLLQPGLEAYPLYKKSRLVAGAEFFPFRKYLFFLEPVLDFFGGSTAGLGTQEDRAIFAINEQVGVSPIICYESVFGEFHTGYVRAGGNLQVIMTNDGWWDNTAGHKQHLRFASLRAIETRRSIARAANTGISAFINPRGDLLAHTRYEEAASLKSRVSAQEGFTFYVQWGNMIGRIALFCTLFLLVNLVVRSKMPTEEA